MPTYNIVNQGADNTGGTAIDTVLNRLVGSDTTIIFEPGTYRLNQLVVPSGVNDLELIAPDGARLVPGRSGDNVRWIDVYSQGFVMDGFELDMRNTAIPPFVRMNSSAGNWELRRLITRGRVRAATDTNIGSNNSSDARTYFRLSAAAGTRGLLQDCYFHEGSCSPSQASNRRAILIESGKGAITFNRCWFESWAENTVYAKKMEGRLKILNSFVRNSQNGLRLGGNTDVQNFVSIKNGQHPIQAWSSGSLQRGANAEATDPANPEQGINSYDGTLTIEDSDFYHRYADDSCGGAITAPTPCQRIDVQNVRISYMSRKSHDAIYTLNGRMVDGTTPNLEYLQLQNVQVRNDHPSQYAISIEQTPDTWGTVSGVLGGTGAQTDSAYVRERMVINGNPTAPDTTPPLPSPPPLGEVPMQDAQLVRIDNTGNSVATSYQITAGEYALPAANDGATMTMEWGPDGGPRRPPTSAVATGTVPAGQAYAFYVTGGIVSTEADGPATWTVDGDVYEPGSEEALLVNRIVSGSQPTREPWRRAEGVVPPNGVVVAKPPNWSGNQPVHVRIRDVTDGGFEYQLEEWLYLDGLHVSEIFHTLAAETGERQLRLGDGSPYRVKSGLVPTSTVGTTVPLGSFFESQPVVMAQSQTYNGNEPIITRVSNVSSQSFNVILQEEEANNGHVTESVGYIALQQATGELNGQPFEVQRTGNSITGEWTRLTFEQQYDDPQFVADMQTLDGIDTASPRYRNLTGTGVDIQVQEEQSADEETAHATEVIGYAVFEGSN